MSQAESLLQQLGITEPQEIDLEAIAYHLNAQVQYKRLRGCEARIIGFRNQAIITVNSTSPLRRKRFSIAHELGHWTLHRGRRLVCRVEEYRPRDRASPERVADAFAADLLFPNYIFKPLANRVENLNFEVVDEIADLFVTSRTATAIRLVERGTQPALLLCHGIRGRKWFTRGARVPEKWFPQKQLSERTSAFSILFGDRREDPSAFKVRADAWFEHPDAQNHSIMAQTVRGVFGEVLTLLSLDKRMLNP